eukprot:2462589-Rhodomonas_salina.1
MPQVLHTRFHNASASRAAYASYSQLRESYRQLASKEQRTRPTVSFETYMRELHAKATRESSIAP